MEISKAEKWLKDNAHRDDYDFDPNHCEGILAEFERTREMLKNREDLLAAMKGERDAWKAKYEDKRDAILQGVMDDALGKMTSERDTLWDEASALKKENERLRADSGREELTRRIKETITGLNIRGMRDAAYYVQTNLPARTEKEPVYCPHMRPEGTMCPHCVGLG